MGDSFSVKAILSAQDKGFTSTIKGAMKATDSLGSKIKSGFNFGVLTGAGQKAFGMITNSVSDLVGEMNSSNAAWKTFEGNLGMLGKGKKDIDKVKKSMQKFAEQTVYSSSDMATTYAQLAAIGVKNTTKLVKGFGGLAAAAENPQQAMKTLSTQATQMAAKPKVAWADFKLMLEQSPAGISAVAKELGYTSKELVALVQDTKGAGLATDKFLNAIAKVGTNKAFSKLATQPKTVGQAVDGLKEAISNKLTPAFDVLSKKGIKIVDKLANKFSKIDAKGLSKKLSKGIKTAEKYWNAFVSSFDGVGKEVKEAFDAVASSMSGFTGEVKKAGSVKSFKSTMESIAGAIKKFANFVEKNADTIGKVLPWIIKLGIAYKALNIVNKVVPGLSAFAKGIAKLAGKSIGAIAGKLFGISSAQKQVGSASVQSATQMFVAAKAYALMGVAVLSIAAGFAILAFSAIALAKAGPLAIGVMAGMLIALTALGFGMAMLLKTLAPMAGQLMPVAVAMLALGGAVVLIAAGFAILAFTAISLANAGGLAIGVMVGLVAVMALLAVGAAVLGGALTAGAVGFIAFGAAIVLCGVGALLAAAALAIISAILPTLTAYGLQGAVAIYALGASLVFFGAGALVAGAGALVLGAGLLVASVGILLCAAGVTLLAAGMLIIGTMAIAAAAGFAIMANVLPLVTKGSIKNAASMGVLSAGLVVLGAGAVVAGAGFVVLGAGLAVTAAGIMLVAVSVASLAAGIVLISLSSMLASAGITLLALTLPLLTSACIQNLASFMALIAGMALLAPAAVMAGAGAVLLGAGLAVAALAVTLLTVSMLVLAAGMSSVSVSAILLTATITLATTSLLVLSALMPIVSALALLVTASFTVLMVTTTVLAATSTVLAAALLLVTVPLGLIGALAIAAGAGMIVFSAGMIVASAGVLVMAAGLKLVNSSMASVAKNAKQTQRSLSDMRNAVKTVSSGLDAIGNKAKSAMKKLLGAFDNTASNVKSSGNKVGKGFTQGMESGLNPAPNKAKQAGKQVANAFNNSLRSGFNGAKTVATLAVVQVSSRLMLGRTSAYSAGAFISLGFAQGMSSQLGAIQSAANKMVSAADKAIRAKAKIHSPSKLSDELGGYFGQGWVNGILDKVADAKKAVQNLVMMPTVDTPNLAFAGSYSGELSTDYDYYRNADYTIVVPLTVDGREIAKATATYTQDELDKKAQRNSRKLGKV